jgi:hypothetical protein
MKYAIFLLGLLVAASAAQTDASHEFRGEIADSSCALNVHSLSRSHKEMLKAKYLGTNEADCARYCVRHLGSSFVLVGGKEVYRLELHQDADPFAGKKVVVKGKLDKQTNTIAVSSIQ